MLYAISCEDKPNSLEKRMAARPEHLKRLEALQAAGRLVLAGPHPTINSTLQNGEPGFSGSLIVAEFKNAEAAKDWANEDPYWLTGVYASVMIKPFKQVFPNDN